MIKALSTIQRSYLRAPIRAFMLSQKQHAQAPLSKPVPNRALAMEHKTKSGGN
jgi:hypothetical protein